MSHEHRRPPGWPRREPTRAMTTHFPDHAAEQPLAGLSGAGSARRRTIQFSFVLDLLLLSLHNPSHGAVDTPDEAQYNRPRFPVIHQSAFKTEQCSRESCDTVAPDPDGESPIHDE